MGRFTQKGDVYLSAKEVALLLQVREGQILHALKTSHTIGNVVLPSPRIINGSRYFLYHEVNAAMVAAGMV